MWQVKVEGKGRYCNIWLLRSEPLTELRSVICHMGSHSVICHPTGERAPWCVVALRWIPMKSYIP